MSKIIQISLALASLAILSSCGQNSELQYVLNVKLNTPHKIQQSFHHKIQKDDRLSIMVSSKSPELTIPFTRSVGTFQTTGSDVAGKQQQASVEYLVDASGYITFPILGRILATGLTYEQFATKLEDMLIKGGYITDATVSVDIKNFKITVLGEVKTPGVKPIDSSRVNVFNALALAGDMSIYGVREDVTLIRESNGQREIVKLNLNDPAIFASPHYYMQPNDILYVKPNGVKSWTADGGNIITQYTLSGIAVILSLFNLLDD